ncbi:MAG: site-specific integrase [Oscillospiraceae bacterium]|nr:site-specific integrase [Oscillospiraceae bacterium]
MAKKAAAGTGTIRKKTVTRAGKQYTYWEARATVGRDPGTGKQVQRSFTGKTQKEVAQKLKAATAAIDNGTYTAPSRLTVGAWLDIWQRDYLGSVKASTAALYRQQIRLYIKPALGALKLDTLNAHTIQGFYNALSSERGLSPKTVKNVHGIFHKALQQAVKIGYLRFNPADACELPRMEKKELCPLDEDDSKAFMQAIKGHRFESLLTVTLFTGLREGEVLGLQWDRVDFQAGTLRIDRQLVRPRGKQDSYKLVATKNSKARTVSPAPWIMTLLKHHRAEQSQRRLRAGSAWEDNGLVFTDELGHHLTHPMVYHSFKRIAAAIGQPNARFHDLRHTYAVNAIRAGDDIKTVQGNLGHATAAFTLDVYGHVTEQMKQDSAQRMEHYIKDVLGL